MQRQNAAERLSEKVKRQELISAAVSKDAQWQRQEASSQATRTKNLVDFALLRNFPGYDTNNPVSTCREHPLSWRLKMFVGPDVVQNDSSKYSITSADVGYDLLGSQSFRNLPPSTNGMASKSNYKQQYIGGAELPVHVLAASNVSYIFLR